MYNDSADLCTDLSNGGNSCPLVAGHNVIKSEGDMFDVSGTIKSKAKWSDSTGAAILCWEIDAHF